MAEGAVEPVAAGEDGDGAGPDVDLVSADGAGPKVWGSDEGPGSETVGAAASVVGWIDGEGVWVAVGAGGGEALEPVTSKAFDDLPATELSAKDRWTATM